MYRSKKKVKTEDILYKNFNNDISCQVGSGVFISTVRDHTNEDDPIKKAIEECIDKGISAEYLKRKRSEVRNMLVAEYSYEEDIKVKQDEAML